MAGMDRNWNDAAAGASHVMMRPADMRESEAAPGKRANDLRAQDPR